MIDETVPKELERICLKAMAKRTSDRYTVALDMKQDLLHFLSDAETVSTVSNTSRPPAEKQPIVSRGLRAFEKDDAYFFLELVPGTRDRHGLPNAIRFWKVKIENVEADDTFRVGVLYGPSGCGKTSLIKAGLLPNLAATISSVYIDCAAADTESRLAQALHRLYPRLTGDSLVDTFAALRRDASDRQSKVVVFLDQFEHWLHERAGDFDTSLTRALRHCDGVRLQCVLMVRDDFWLGVSRFLDELDVDLLEGQNAAFVDLFDQRHARKVLIEYGRAYGCLRNNIDELSAEQNEFADQVIAELSQNGKVVPVRLSLYVEMIKGRPWNDTTLHDVRATGGIGVQFLDDAFGPSNCKHRQHYDAARLVLRALLPESGTDIRRTKRSVSELREISGYAYRPREFAELLRVLDRDTRLLSPADPDEVAVTDSEPTEKYFQLTHDYLVHSLRNWLTREQRKHQRGRAELLVAERAAAWEARGDTRDLPNVWEAVKILAFTRAKDWTDPQRTMMTNAKRRLFKRLSLAAVITAVLLTALYVRSSRIAVESLLSPGSKLEVVQARAETLRIYWPFVAGRLKRESQGAQRDRKLRATIVLLQQRTENPKELIEFMTDKLLSFSADEFSAEDFGVLRDCLEPYKAGILDILWTKLRGSKKDEEILHAASALARFDLNNSAWTEVSDQVTLALISSNTFDLKEWLSYLSPVSRVLLDSLLRFQTNPDTADLTVTQRTAAAHAIVYFADRVNTLLEALLAAEPFQFKIFYDGLGLDELDSEKGDSELIANVLHHALMAFPTSGRLFNIPFETENALNSGEISLALRKAFHDNGYPLAQGASVSNVVASLRWLVTDAESVYVVEKGQRELNVYESEALLDRKAIKQVNAAIALLLWKKDGDEIREILRPRADPRAASYFVNYVPRCGVEAGLLWECYKQESDPDVRQIWIQCLGKSREDLEPLSSEMEESFKTDRNCGMHGAAEWFLRNKLWSNDKIQEIKKTKLAEDETKLNARLKADRSAEERNWYVSSEGHTLVILSFEPEDSKARAYELAVSTCEVTKLQFQRFLPKFDPNVPFDTGSDSPRHMSDFAREDQCPALGITWFEAAAYCNWLSWKEGIPRHQFCYVFRRGENELDADFLAVEFVGSEAKTKYWENATYWETTDVVVELAPDWQEKSGYRLPTENEWAFACEAGATTDYHFGSTQSLLAEYAWFGANSARVDLEYECSHTVGTKLPNRFGLFDMHGNVYEWCQPGPHNLKNGVIIEPSVKLRSRGGSYSSASFRLPTHVPNIDEASKRDWKTGVRVVRTLPH
jgi:formylglycine-generating enzyme required for sulfatase activity